MTSPSADRGAGAPRRVVVIAPLIETDLEVERSILNGAGAELADARGLAREDALEVLRSATGVLTAGFDFDFAAMPYCRAISLYSIGFDAVDVEAASRAGIAVINAPRYGVQEVADHTLTLLLPVWRKLAQAQELARSDDWSLGALEPIPRLRGQTLGLVGFGAIARAVAKRAQAFGLKIVAYDAYVEPSLGDAFDVELLPLDDVLARSDALSIHVPLTEATKGMIGRAQLAALPPGAVVVSTSRGAVIDEEALLEALDGGHLAGAGLDVLVTEPPTSPSSRRLAAHPLVICTPHMGYYSEGAMRDLRVAAAGSMATLLRGEMPPSVVNADALARLAHD
jgi:D-3-phosphoglycerate dehydrogenase / 2-oxoglutarate reductase